MSIMKTHWTAAELHDALDTVLAQYLSEVPGALPSQISVLELLQWHWAKMQQLSPQPKEQP